MKLVKFTPSKGGGAILGQLEFVCDKPINIKCNIVKNSKNGSLFPSMPSRQYKNKNDETKYENLAYFEKENSENMQKEILALYEESIKQSSEQEFTF